MKTVAEYIIDLLANSGIDRAFLTYGGAIADLVDALPGRMAYTVMIHEQAAVFAAEGYAQVSGKPGLVIVTSGPGGGNIVSGLQNCFYNSVPLIALTGQVSSRFMRPKASGLRQLGFQETDIVNIATPITKYARTVMDAAEIGWTMDQAIYSASARRPGSVLIDLPNDIQRMEVDPLELSEWKPTIVNPAVRYDPKQAAQEFLDDLGGAKRPGILVGGGAYKARKDILDFALGNRIPVFRTWNAQDICPDDHPCYGGTVGTYGGPGRNFGVQNTDLLLCLGCRLSGRITGGVPHSFARGAKLYVVDVDPGLLEPKYQPRKADVNVLCDCKEFINALA